MKVEKGLSSDLSLKILAAHVMPHPHVQALIKNGSSNGATLDAKVIFTRD